MRITFVLPPVDMSGGIRTLAIHAERLRHRGHRVVVVSVRPAGPTLRQIARSLLKGQPWHSSRPGPSHFDGLEVDHRRLKHTGPVTDRDVPEADVVVASWWETAYWVADLSPAKGVKAHFVQGYEVFGGKPEVVDGAYKLPLAKIVISRWLGDLLQKKFHQVPAAIVHNSVDTDRFRTPPRGKQVVPTVGLIYSPDFIKGCDVALQAFELAKKELPGLRLVAMGYDQVEDTLPLPEGTEFTYRARDQKVVETYSRCDAWLFPSRSEGFGLPILEAMACRTPVIGTPAGAAPDLLSKGGGILVPPDDPQAMARAIIEVCMLPETAWRAMSDAALGTVEAFTWNDATDLFEEALHQVVMRKRVAVST
jgi:glycosyltransferase involved in cell wall biosynthesis